MAAFMDVVIIRIVNSLILLSDETIIHRFSKL